MPTVSACANEIEALHDRFVEWFTGTRPNDIADRLGSSLAPEFEMITPDGDRLNRSTVIKSVDESYDRKHPEDFDIDIQNVERVADLGTHVVVRYEEWQTTPAGTTGRISTGLFRDDSGAPKGVRWVDLHETWIDG